MPHNKQQHYVPRCYLKPFSLNQDGAAINLFNISRRKHIENAPIKGQCARAYFYGEDLRIERWLQSFESEYAKIVREIQNRTQLAEDDLGVLRTFAYLQYSRTEMAIRRRRIAEEGMQNAVYEGRPVAAPDLDVGDRTIMLRSMLTYFQSREYVDDLKITILDNQTQVDFVTSDDPAVFVNRFYTQRVKSQSFGIKFVGCFAHFADYAPICFNLL